jgi:hypothetical protein
LFPGKNGASSAMPDPNQIVKFGLLFYKSVLYLERRMIPLSTYIIIEDQFPFHDVYIVLYMWSHVKLS